MNTPTKADIGYFLEQFFGTNNKFDLGKIERGEGDRAKIRPWIERLTQIETLPTVLPYWHEGKVDWYGIAISERQLRSLSEELMAFVGPTYSTFRGQRAQLNQQDPVELAVYQLTKGAAVKFSGDPKTIWEALEKMRLVGERRVKRIIEQPRPTGRVLRDFYMALRAGDRTTAENALQYLQDQHRLNALNLIFLRVQLLAELECWDQLLALPELPNLLQVRRPFAVTQALLQAIYRIELQRFEENNAPIGAINYFHQAIFPHYSNLFAVRAGSKIPEVLKLFMLLAVGGVPQPDLRDELLSIPGIETADLQYLQQLAALLPDATPQFTGTLLERAKQLSTVGNYDQAFLFVRNAQSSQEKVRLLLECAYELQTLEAERAALQAYDELTADEQQHVQAVRWNREQLARLQGTEQSDKPTAESVPTNWLDWLYKLNQEPDWERAIYIARQGALEWDVTILLTKPEAVEQFIILQETIFSQSELILRDALPYLLASFQKEPLYPRREFSPIYISMLALLVLTTEGGEPDLVLFNDLTIGLLTLGVDRTKYIEIVDYTIELWDQFASPKKVEWAFDVLDLLVLYPCPSPEKRFQLLFIVAESLGHFANRIDSLQRSIFESLVKDLNQEESFPDLFINQSTLIASSEDEKNIFQRLKNKSVLIYTLTESAGLRVKSVLESACENLTVHLSHDKGGNERLRQLTRNSDIVVMATASATHAATNFIEAHRPQGLPILLPAGKGSTSILREIRQYLF